jgi:hypothetical protein
MGDLPQALPRTVIAADHVRRHASRAVIQHQATDLLLAAARAESIAVSGRRAAVPPQLLRELVAITGALAGRKWLKANAASAAVETFAAVNAEPGLPALPALDHALSALLWSRFSGPATAAGATITTVSPTTRGTGGKGGSVAAGTRLLRFGARRHKATA